MAGSGVMTIFVYKAFCPLEAIQAIALLYRYNFRSHSGIHGLGSIAKFYRFFQILFFRF